MARAGVANPRKRSAITRAKLLEAAAQVFAEEGYDGTTLTAVARRAAVTTGAIYSNFHGKGDLLCEVLRGRLLRHDEVREALTVARDVHPLKIALATESMQPDRSRMHALLLEAFAVARRNPAVQEMLRALVTDITGELAKRVRIAQRRGLIAGEISPETLAWFYLAPTAWRAFTEALDMTMPAPETWPPILERFDRALKADATASG